MEESSAGQDHSAQLRDNQIDSHNDARGSTDSEQEAAPGDLYVPTPHAPDFAPGEPTDGRNVGNWRTRYSEREARVRIRLEAAYVLAMLIINLGLILAIALEFPRPTIGLSPERWQSLSPFALAFAGGALGGTLFSTKWLYHTVARGIWNVDRWLWRVFTPLLSAGAAFTIVTLSAGGIIPLFGSNLVRTNAGALGVALLIGYFSDRTFSWLERLAEEHLGTAKGYRSSREDDHGEGTEQRED